MAANTGHGSPWLEHENGARLDLGAFEALFRPHIRTLLNWDYLRRCALPVRIRVTDQAAGLRHLYTPWYPNLSGGDEYLAGAPALTFDDIRRRPEYLDAGRRSRIEALVAAMRGRPQSVLVAGYDFGTGRICLDGNHRLAATVLGGLPNTVLEVNVCGPRDPDVLPDLANVSPGRSPGRRT